MSPGSPVCVAPMGLALCQWDCAAKSVGALGALFALLQWDLRCANGTARLTEEADEQYRLAKMHSAGLFSQKSH